MILICYKRVMTRRWLSSFLIIICVFSCMFVYINYEFKIDWDMEESSEVVREGTTTYNPSVVESIMERHDDDLNRVGIPNLKRDASDGSWYWMESASVYIYTAHYDDRPALQGPPVVRVIIVSDLSETANILCKLWFNQEVFTTVWGSIKAAGAGVFSSSAVLFREAVVSCPVVGIQAPTHVTILLGETDEPTFAVPVEQATKYDKTHEFGICVSLSYWHHKPYRLIEWIEFQRLMGVGAIIIYNNTLSKAALSVFTQYAKEEHEFFAIRQSHNFYPFPGETRYHIQMSPVINDCMYRYRHRFHSILVIDFDEFLVPTNTSGFKDMVAFIMATSGIRHAGYTYTFRNAYFFFDFANRRNQPKELITLRHTRRAKVSERGYAAKSMIGTNTCVVMHNHYCWQSTPIVQDAFEYPYLEIDPDIAKLHHYKHCHLEENKCSDMFKTETDDPRMLDFAEDLKRAVNVKRFRLGMQLL